MALLRSLLVMALAGDILVFHAPVASNTFALAKEAANARKTLWTVDDPSNGPLKAFGAHPLGEIPW